MEVDYILVGAGSAGCILAEKLTQSGQYTVLVLESGGKLLNPWITVPAGFSSTYYHPRYNYMYQSQGEKHLKNRSIYVPRGKGLGGSGSINAMIYVRGQRQDFHDWACAGNPEWQYDKLLPYFKDLEEHPYGPSEFHGSQGALGITPLNKHAHPICDHYLNAIKELQLPQTQDFNGQQFEGAGIYEANIRNGKRDSSYTAFLKPALQRSNLLLWTHAVVQKLTLESKQVTGVEAVYKGQLRHIKARKEVILCAGAVANPKLLQLSGIGDPKLLNKHHIPLAHALPMVGQNLQDHLCVSFYFRSHLKTLNDVFGSWQGKLAAGFTYVTQRKGPLSVAVNQAGGFFKGCPTEKTPNLQVYFNPLSYEIPQSSNAKLSPLPYSGYLMAVNSCRPSSRGTINIASANVNDAPLIAFNYLSTQKDQLEAIQACKLVRKIAGANALQKITVREEKPAHKVQSDAQMLEYFRSDAGSIYHLCGTCAMGEDPNQSVVNQQLKVHGIDRLRVCDASIFPNITSGNTNAATMMVAAKAADLILA